MPLFFSFDLFLEVRAEILEKISLFSWKIWRHQKDIVKLTLEGPQFYKFDVQPGSTSNMDLILFTEPVGMENSQNWGRSGIRNGQFEVFTLEVIK